MKVNVTCTGCEITVEEVDGKCIVTALQDGEVVEEFTVDCEVEGAEAEVENDDVAEVDVDVDVEVEGGEEGEDEEVLEESTSVKTFSEFFVTEEADNGEEAEEKSSKE